MPMLLSQCYIIRVLWLLDLPPIRTGILDNAADLLCLKWKSTARLQLLVSRCQRHTQYLLYCISICTYCDFASFLCAKGIAHQYTCVLVYRCYKEEPRVLLGRTAELHVVHKVVTIDSLGISIRKQQHKSLVSGSLHLYLVYAEREDQFHTHGFLLTTWILVGATVNRTASPLRSSNFFLLISLAISTHPGNPLSTASALISCGKHGRRRCINTLLRPTASHQQQL